MQLDGIINYIELSQILAQNTNKQYNSKDHIITILLENAGYRWINNSNDA